MGQEINQLVLHISVPLTLLGTISCPLRFTKLNLLGIDETVPPMVAIITAFDPYEKMGPCANDNLVGQSANGIKLSTYEAECEYARNTKILIVPILYNAQPVAPATIFPVT